MNQTQCYWKMSLCVQKLLCVAPIIVGLVLAALHYKDTPVVVVGCVLAAAVAGGVAWDAIVAYQHYKRRLLENPPEVEV